MYSVLGLNGIVICVEVLRLPLSLTQYNHVRDPPTPCKCCYLDFMGETGNIIFKFPLENINLIGFKLYCCLPIVKVLCDNVISCTITYAMKQKMRFALVEKRHSLFLIYGKY